MSGLSPGHNKQEGQNVYYQKKYEEDIRKAVEQATERIFDRQYADDRFRSVHERIDDLDRRMRMVEYPEKRVEGFCPRCPEPVQPLPRN